MNQRAKASAYELGLTGGIVNGLFGILALRIMIKGLSYHPGGIHPIPPINIYILSVGLVLMCILNFIGSCVCRNRRIAGGVMMLVSAILLLFLMIIAMSYDIVFFSYSAVTMPNILCLLTQILSITSTIICFAGPATTAQQQPEDKF